MDLKIDLRHRWRDALARHRPVALVEPRDAAAVLVGVVAEEDGSGDFRVLAYASPVEPRGRVGHLGDGVHAGHHDDLLALRRRRRRRGRHQKAEIPIVNFTLSFGQPCLGS